MCCISRVDRDAEELTSQFFSYRRNDGRHKAVAKTPTWQVINQILKILHIYLNFQKGAMMLMAANQSRLCTCTYFQDGRETNIRVRLPVGKYCIVPSTYLPDMEGDFILR